MNGDYIECPDCQANPYNRDERIIFGSLTGTPTTTYHTKDCPHYGIWREEVDGGRNLRPVRPDEEQP